jgi:TatA/E family protein of Tat protein translocase
VHSTSFISEKGLLIGGFTLIGLPEVILILAILLVFIGPEKLPEIAKELGGAVREFRKVSSRVTETVNSLKVVEKEHSDELLEIARKLKIGTKGKTTKQLINEIMMKIDK